MTEPPGPDPRELAAAEETLRSYVRNRPYEEITDELKDLLAEYEQRGRIAEAADALLVRWYGEDHDEDVERRGAVAEVDPALFELIYALGAAVGGIDV
jgi:hypothetical protein